MSRAARRHPERHRRPTAGKVVVSYPRPDMVDGLWADSVIMACLQDGSKGGRSAITRVISVASSALICSARNDIVRGFLADDDAEFLFMSDTDMPFTVQRLYEMIDTARENDLPLLGGLYFGWGHIHGERVPRPQLYRVYGRDEDGTVRISNELEVPEPGLHEYHATGAGCLLVRRDVLEKVGAINEGHPFPWFQETVIGKKPLGEDITFCLRARSAGFPLTIHTGFEFPHRKMFLMTSDTYRNALPRIAALLDEHGNEATE